jgi:hypothetical protein
VKNLDTTVLAVLLLCESGLVHFVANPPMRYRAAITTTSGTFLDQGESPLVLLDVGDSVEFFEQFLSSGPPTPIDHRRRGNDD